MPAHRKPTALLKAAGSIAHDPQRYRERKNEPAPNGPLGTPPKHLTPDQKKNWKELDRQAPTDVLTRADRWTVELIVVLMSKLRDGSIRTGEIAQLGLMLSKCGMNPSDRSRVHATTPREEIADDPWTQIVQ
jgi:phage terminase small subunit